MDEFNILWAVKDTRMKIWRSALKYGSNSDLRDAEKACREMGEHTKAKIIGRELRNRERRDG